MTSGSEEKTPRGRVALPTDARLPASAAGHASSVPQSAQPLTPRASIEMPALGTILSGRYELRRALGSGAYGQVFSAWDHARGKLFAIKILRDARPDSLLQFKQEFRALSELRHPNLVRFLKLGRSDAMWFIVMEQIDGAPITVARPNDEYSTGERNAAMETTVAGPGCMTRPHTGALSPALALPIGGHVTPLLDVETLRDRLWQLADGLRTLHRFGVIHCDLKPSNVMVDGNGRVVILDFGVARYTQHIGAHHQQVRAYSGTRPYMAPEVSSALRADPALDWFAVGMMLAEMLTSLAPSMLANATYAQQRTLFAAAAVRHPDYADLYALAIALMDPNVATRAGLDDVLRCVDSALAASSAPTQGLGYAFLGRDTELARLEAAWERFGQNEATIQIVEGEGGIGKSTLCGEFLRRVAFRDAPPIILLARCRSDELLGYRAFDELVDGIAAVLKTLPPHDLARLRSYCSPALVTLFPTLAPFAINHEGEAPHASEDPLYALRQLIAHVAALRKIAIWVEDLHLADRDSLRWFARIFTPGECPTVFLLLSQRPTTAAPFAEDIDIDTFGYAVPILRLRGLDAGAAQQAVNTWLPDDLHDRARTMAMLTALGNGNPYVLRELCREGEQIQFLSKSVTLIELLRGRTQRLPAHIFDTLLAIATGFEPVSRRILHTITGLDLATLDEALEYLEDTTLIWQAASLEDDYFEAIHTSVREVCIADAAKNRVQAFHNAHAQIGIKRRGAPMRPATIVTHLVRAGRRADAESYAETIADAALANGAYESASQMYDLLIQIAEDDRRTPSTRIRERAVECRLRTGRGADAAMLLDTLADDLPDDQARALRRRAAESLVLSGQIEAGLAMNAAASPAGVEPSAAAPPSIFALAAAERKLHKRLIAIKDIGPMRTLTESETAQIDTYRILGIDLGMIDAMRGFEFTMREVALSIGTNDPARIVRSLSGYCAFNSMSGGKKAEQARAYMDIAKRIVTNVDDQVTHEWLNICEGVLEYHGGQYRKGWDRIKVSYDWMYANASNQHMILSWLEMHRLFCAQVIGDIPGLRTAYYGQIVDARARNNRLHEASVTLIGFITWLVDDAPDAGRAAIDRIQIARTSDRYQLYDYLQNRAKGDCILYKQAHDTDYDAALSACRKLEFTLLGRSVELCLHEGRIQHARLLFARARRNGALTTADGLLLKWLGRSLARSKDKAMSAGSGHCILAGLYHLRGDVRRARIHIRQGVDILIQGEVTLYGELARLAGHSAGLLSCDGDPLAPLRELGVVAPHRLASSYHAALIGPR